MSKNVFGKLQEARKKLSEKELKKSGNNKYAGFMYFELADFLPTVNKIFDEVGLCSIFNLDNEIATLKIINTEQEDIIITFSTPVVDVVMKNPNPIQVLGSKHTYLKRYLYLNALEIAENDFVDATTGKDEVKPPKQTKTTKSTKKTTAKQKPEDNFKDLSDIPIWLEGEGIPFKIEVKAGNEYAVVQVAESTPEQRIRLAENKFQYSKDNSKLVKKIA